MCLAAAALPPASAIPVGTSNLPREYVVGNNLPRIFSCGVYAADIQRDADIGSTTVPMEYSKGMAYVGVDVVRFATLYGAIGVNNTKVSQWMEDTDETALDYEGGLTLRFLDQEIMDPTLMENRLRICAGVSYSQTTFSLGGQSKDWGELQASVIVSIVNDLTGDRLFLPDSIAIYAGPLYSDIISNEIDESTQFGFAVGIQVFLDEHTSLDFGIRQFDSTGYAGGVHVRF